MTPYLYLIMRNDLESMNPGKLAAQACHVGHACAGAFHKLSPSEGKVSSDFLGLEDTQVDKFIDLIAMWREWENSTTQHFGTTICLACDEAYLTWFRARTEISFENRVLTDVVWDPTYPCKIPLEIAKYLTGKLVVPENIIVRNNDAILLREEIVGAYAFGDKENPYMQELLGDLPLYP